MASTSIPQKPGYENVINVLDSIGRMGESRYSIPESRARTNGQILLNDLSKQQIQENENKLAAAAGQKMANDIAVTYNSWAENKLNSVLDYFRSGDNKKGILALRSWNRQFLRPESTIRIGNVEIPNRLARTASKLYDQIPADQREAGSFSDTLQMHSALMSMSLPVGRNGEAVPMGSVLATLEDFTDDDLAYMSLGGGGLLEEARLQQQARNVARASGGQVTPGQVYAQLKDERDTQNQITSLLSLDDPSAGITEATANSVRQFPLSIRKLALGVFNQVSPDLSTPEARGTFLSAFGSVSEELAAQSDIGGVVKYYQETSGKGISDANRISMAVETDAAIRALSPDVRMEVATLQREYSDLSTFELLRMVGGYQNPKKSADVVQRVGTEATAAGLSTSGVIGTALSQKAALSSLMKNPSDRGAQQRLQEVSGKINLINDVMQIDEFVSRANEDPATFLPLALQAQYKLEMRTSNGPVKSLDTFDSWVMGRKDLSEPQKKYALLVARASGNQAIVEGDRNTNSMAYIQGVKNQLEQDLKERRINQEDVSLANDLVAGLRWFEDTYDLNEYVDQGDLTAVDKSWFQSVLGGVKEYTTAEGLSNRAREAAASGAALEFFEGEYSVRTKIAAGIAVETSMTSLLVPFDPLAKAASDLPLPNPLRNKWLRGMAERADKGEITPEEFALAVDYASTSKTELKNQTFADNRFVGKRARELALAFIFRELGKKKIDEDYANSSLLLQLTSGAVDPATVDRARSELQELSNFDKTSLGAGIKLERSTKETAAIQRWLESGGLPEGDGTLLNRYSMSNGALESQGVTLPGAPVEGATAPMPPQTRE